MHTCEMCHTRKGAWYLYDENAEVTLCPKCVKELKSNGEILERIK